jgi:ABC-type polysaccharide transport system permease subunit
MNVNVNRKFSLLLFLLPIFFVFLFGLDIFSVHKVFAEYEGCNAYLESAWCSPSPVEHCTNTGSCSSAGTTSSCPAAKCGGIVWFGIILVIVLVEIRVMVSLAKVVVILKHGMVFLVEFGAILTIMAHGMRVRIGKDFLNTVMLGVAPYYP